MVNSINLPFEQLLKTTELRKVEFKERQYRLDNDVLKSHFVKDILCMANAPGEDGYILLGVREKPREVVGISTHHDGAMLAEIVAGVIEEPIHFDYFPVVHKGRNCALLRIPSSRARPHRPKRDFGILRKYVFYTRRSSGNVEASLSEIREMFLSTIRVSDVARRRATTTPHVVDELASFDLDKRKQIMYDMLRSIVSKLSLSRYSLVSSEVIDMATEAFALVTSTSTNSTREYAIFMYPWVVRKDDVRWSRSSLRNIIDSTRYPQGKPSIARKRKSIIARLKGCTLVHISYQNIYTKALESKYYLVSRGELAKFANEWNESWGKIIKWVGDIPQWKNGKTFYSEQAYYEFFLSNVSSKPELSQRMTELLSWVDSYAI
jgi:hypothetical protein